MGGSGSGREAYKYSGTVEESLSLDVNGLVRDGIIRPGVDASGSLSWRKLIGEDPSIGFETQCYRANGHIYLQYQTSSLITGRDLLYRDI